MDEIPDAEGLLPLVLNSHIQHWKLVGRATFIDRLLQTQTSLSAHALFSEQQGVERFHDAIFQVLRGRGKVRGQGHVVSW
jgi:hypothetical protein